MVRRKRFGLRLVDAYSMKPERVYALRQVLSSYLGHFKHADTWNLVIALFARHDWLLEYFFLDNGKIPDWFRHKGVFRTLRGQVNFFKARLGDTLCFMQVGRYYELYGSQARCMAAVLNLKLKTKCRRMSCGIGFPVWRVRH
ncbi:MAG: hypothetical protein E4H46_01230 [Desulfobacterales bacterium]|nr:MAG: hypothetical protein E4H46_01230 [Desulfobacterales bacterium]